jgi:Ser/Thr protein kinase RdoA (MazF antagonist)
MDLRAILRMYPTSAQPLSAPEPLGNAGGFSGARLWRFPSPRGPLVLRAWPEEGRDATAILQIHRWLQEAGTLGFIPVPLLARDGRTLVRQANQLWELAPWLSGVADRNRPPRRERLRAGFAALAAFHQRLAHHQTGGPSPGLARRLLEIEALQRGGFATLERAIQARSAEPEAQPARRWLALAQSLAPEIAERLRRDAARVVTLQPCLRDARPDHLLFEGDRLTGLVDFGAMAVESVACDLARLLAEWVGPDCSARAEALAHYSHVRPLDPRETELIATFESATALLTAAHWARWHFLERRVFDDPSAALHGLECGFDRLAEQARGKSSPPRVTELETGWVLLRRKPGPRADSGWV